MSNITPSPLLIQVVNIVKNVISDLKVEYTSPTIAHLKDGNDSIYLEQRFDKSGNSEILSINDAKEIIFSEDLLPVLKDLNQNATILINDLDVETRLVLETAKDAFDQLSSSYEFVKITEKQLTKVKSDFKFENHRFEVMITNELNHIVVEASFSSKIDPSVKKIIEADTFKVQQSIGHIFKA
ncbi:hypothetical protein WG904_17845 [Pedobacter sp. Du54]|uniref:hypothetical protein n=1 Tax=Pedobacter anseongensis TaxID=3133439 RepID=UPI0030B67963